MKAITLVLFVATLSFGQDNKGTSKAPEVPKDVVARYFKAAAQQAQSQVILDRAQKDFETKTQLVQQVVLEMTKVCGEKYQPNLSAQGDPECIVKPKAAEPAKK